MLIGDKLVSANGEDLFVEDYSVELTEESVSVYNFQVDDFHTYFVGDCEVWVHNATCTPSNRQKVKEHLEGSSDNSGAKSNGAINGCHEESVFLNELDASGGDIVNVTSVKGIDGVNVVEYETSSGRIKTKTTYDSSIISTEQYLDRGMEALNNVPGELSNIGDGMQVAPDNSGVNWNIFIRDHEVITMYPS